MSKSNANRATLACGLVAVSTILVSCAQTIERNIETTITLPQPPYLSLASRKDNAEPVNVRQLYGASIGVSHYNSRISHEYSPLPAHALSAASIIDILDPFYTYEREQYREGIRLTTELRLKPDGKNNPGIINKLSMSIGERSISPYDFALFQGTTPNKDGTWPFFGDNKPITKEKALAAIGAGVSDLVNASKNGTATGLFYINAHGVMIGDVAYLIPGDATLQDSGSWISINEFLSPIYEVAKNQPQSNPNRRILIIIDACLKGGAGKLKIPPPPPGVALVFATSPGQYSWHYPESTAVKQTIVTNGGNKEFQESLQETKMSYIPIALSKSIEDFGRNLEKMDKIDSHKIDDRYRSNIKMGPLLAAIKSNMENLISADKIITTNGGQTMTTFLGPGVEGMDFITVNRIEFQRPREKQYGISYMQ